MSENTREPNDIRVLGYVLKRTNYSEADRILNLITPVGKRTAIAKGVRKARSKLAGGVEMFTLSEYNLHFGRGEMGVVTGVKMVRYLGNILKDYERMELAGVILKRVSRVAESSDNPEYFNIVDQALSTVDNGADTRLVESWFVLNLLRTMGEEVNLYRDVSGVVLKPDLQYDWDVVNEAFNERENGEFGVNEIKLLRLMTTTELSVARRVKVSSEMMDRVLDFTRLISKM